MRLGIYGGTFDPIHLGHLLLAETCREVCQLDEVWFIPAASPPHKQGNQISSARDRVQMLEFAIAGHPQFKLNKLELKRTGPSFTVDTLEQIQQEDSTRELFLLLGGDSIIDFPTWREPQQILELATVVAVNRGRDRVNSAGWQALGTNALDRLQIVNMPAIEISATQMRQSVSQGKSIRFQTPRSVEMYILQKGLYRNPPVVN